MSRTHLQAIAELILAGAIWGFGFSASVWALEAMTPLALTGWRFAVAAAVGFAISFCVRAQRAEINLEQLKLSFIPGFLIGITILLQTWGLKYTTATKCGFITTLYAVIVPVMERVWLKRSLPRLQPVYVAVALIGTALITDLPSELLGLSAKTAPSAANEWNFGDTLTLLCAFTAALHMVWFAFIHTKIRSSFAFNNFQSLWSVLLTLPLAFLIDPLPTMAFGANRAFLGFVSLAIFSTMFAFALQVRAQKVLSPSIASLLFLLESPFAGLFALYLLGETLNGLQWVGAALILAAAGFSSYDSAKNAQPL